MKLSYATLGCLLFRSPCMRLVVRFRVGLKGFFGLTDMRSVSYVYKFILIKSRVQSSP